MVKIEIHDGILTLSSPYSSALPPKAKALGGRFDGATKSWRFDPRDEARVRELAREIYGTDGTPEELVSVRVRADLVSLESVAELELFGRTIVRRWRRDEAPRLGNGVVIVEGGFPRSGGSTKYPELDPFDGTVLEIRDVPAGAARKAASERPNVISVVEPEKVDRAALEAERAAIVARLAEIDAALARA